MDQIRRAELLMYPWQTSLASRALDGMSDPATKSGVIDELLRYLDTDTTWSVRPSPCLS